MDWLNHKSKRQPERQTEFRCKMIMLITGCLMLVQTVLSSKEKRRKFLLTDSRNLSLMFGTLLSSTAKVL